MSNLFVEPRSVKTSYRYFMIYSTKMSSFIYIEQKVSEIRPPNINLTLLALQVSSGATYQKPPNLKIG